MAGQAWEAWEDHEVRILYPTQGTRACQLALPHRSRKAIHWRASEMGLRIAGRVIRKSGKPSPQDHSPVVTPAHDYTDIDRLWIGMQARLPAQPNARFGVPSIGVAA